MKRIWAGLLIMSLLVGCLGTGLCADNVVEAEILPLPEAVGGSMAAISVESDPAIGPHESGYAFREGDRIACSYSDPSITVNIGWGRYEKTNYVYARVKIADPAQLRTALAATINSEKTVVGSTLAKRVNAVLAINGDFLARQNNGTVIRQGEVLRLNSKGDSDVLLIDRKGDTHILENATNEDIEAWVDDAVNVFTFGPGLIINGVAKYGYRDGAMGTYKNAQRMAFCQTGPLEYLLLTTEGPEQSGSTGMKLDSFVALLEEFGGIINAYNLDGGNSATVNFRKGDDPKGNWSKINARGEKPRALRDIIYFATTWMPDGQ